MARYVGGVKLVQVDGVWCGVHDFGPQSAWTLEVVGSQVNPSLYTCVFVHKTTKTTATALRSTGSDDDNFFEHCDEDAVRRLVGSGENLQEDGTLYDCQIVT
jgi:hypothetical protein